MAEQRTPTEPSQAPAEGPRVFEESLHGARIDSARISVMAALHFAPPDPLPSRIVLPGDDDEVEPNLANCLYQAAQWLDAARALTLERAATPPTSLHVVAGGRVGG